MPLALIDRTGFDVDALDGFCGFGGSSQGIIAAGATLRMAINHDAHSIKVHSHNNPDVEHLQADLSDALSPEVVNERGKKVSGRYIDPALLPRARFSWWSPSCKFHSPANARKLYAQGPQAILPGLDEDDFDHVAYSNSERSRVTMLCPLRYAAHQRPDVVVVENVVEAAHWGPRRSDKSKVGDGSTFRWWINEWTLLDYEHDILFLNSMFFPPCPQSRDRMYVVFWRKGNRKPELDYRPTAMCVSDRCQGAHVQAVQTWKRRTQAWPLERWGKYGDQYIYTCPDCKQRVHPVAWPAYTAIDWSDLGPTLGERRELGRRVGGYPAESTIERIKRGYAKFRHGPAVLIPTKKEWGVERGVLTPMGAQTSQQEVALGAFGGSVLPLRKGASAVGPAGQIPTLAGRSDQALIGHALLIRNYGSIDEAGYRAYHPAEPFGTFTTTGRAAQMLASSGFLFPRYGNTHERAGQTRGRHIADAAYTQHATDSFALAQLPMILEYRGGGSNERSVVDPLATVTAGGFHHGLFTKLNGGPGDTAWHEMDEQLRTITGRDTHGLIVLPWIEQWRSDPIAVTEALATVMTHLRHTLVSIEPGEEPTDEELDQIRLRMLNPEPELQRGMAFEDTFVLLGTKTQKVAGLGNAVTPPVATYITRQCIDTFDLAA